jgi:hypothetical protein
MAFPEMTGSQPTADEMEGKPIDDFAGTTIDGATGEVVQKKELPAYSDEQFRKNLPAWRDMIASGKKSADQIIATVETKGKLTDEQKASIRATPAKTEAPADGDGVMSDDEVAAIHAREMAEAGQ